MTVKRLVIFMTGLFLLVAAFPVTVWIVTGDPGGLIPLTIAGTVMYGTMLAAYLYYRKKWTT